MQIAIWDMQTHQQLQTIDLGEAPPADRVRRIIANLLRQVAYPDRLDCRAAEDYIRQCGIPHSDSATTEPAAT